jgi:hypothetical protein
LVKQTGAAKMNEYQYWMTSEEIELYHLDMERSYEDASYDLDGINAELQQLAQGE